MRLGIDDTEGAGAMTMRSDPRSGPAVDAPVVLARGSSPSVARPHDPALAQLPEAAFRIDDLGVIEAANALAERLVGLDQSVLFGRDIDSLFVGLRAATTSEARVELNGGTVFIPASAGVCVMVEGRAVPVTVLLSPCEQGSRLAIVTSLFAAGVKLLREDDVAQLVHDLKSPLAAIALETDMLGVGGAEGGAAEGAERVLLARVVHRIVMNVSLLDRMISNLVDFCAPDTGRISLHRSRVELRSLVERVVERVVPSRDRPRIVLRMPIRVVLEVDEHRIERVIANLVQNALKDASRDSQVVIAVDLHRAYLRVSVADRGPGIAVQHQAALFDKHPRPQGTQLHEGTGLGLYISKRIVEAHGGTFGVDSVEGRGSCFYFELPQS